MGGCASTIRCSRACGGSRPKYLPTQRLRTADLRAGQTLTQDFLSPEGVLLLSAGQQLNDDLIGRICAFERKHGLALTLGVQVSQEAGR